MTDLSSWHSEVTTLTANLAHRWPQLADDLDDVTHLASQIVHALPRAQAMTDPGDGLRSPDLTGGGRGGGHGSTTERTAIPHADATDPRTNSGRPHQGLVTSATHRHNTVTELRLAHSTNDEQQVRQHIHEARNEATRALSALHRLLPKASVVRNLQPQGDPGCASCRRIKDSKGRPFFSDTRTPGSTYCRDCEDFRRAYGKLPSIGVLEMMRDGIRRTKERIDRAEADERWRNKRKKKRAS